MKLIPACRSYKIVQSWCWPYNCRSAITLVIVIWKQQNSVIDIVPRLNKFLSCRQHYLNRLCSPTLCTTDFLIVMKMAWPCCTHNQYQIMSWTYIGLMHNYLIIIFTKGVDNNRIPRLSQIQGIPKGVYPMYAPRVNLTGQQSLFRIM